MDEVHNALFERWVKAKKLSNELEAVLSEMGEQFVILKALPRTQASLVQATLEAVGVGSAVYSAPNINVTWSAHPNRNDDFFAYQIRVLVNGVEHPTGITVAADRTSSVIQQATFGFVESDVVVVEIFAETDDVELIQSVRSVFDPVTVAPFVVDANAGNFGLTLDPARTAFTLAFSDSANYPSVALRSRRDAGVYSEFVTDDTSSTTLIQPTSTLGAVLDSVGGVYDYGQTLEIQAKLGDGLGNFSVNWVTVASFTVADIGIGFTWTHQSSGLISGANGSEFMATAPYLFGAYWEEDFADGTFFTVPNLVANGETGTQLSTRASQALADGQEAILVVPTYSHSEWNASGLKDDPDSGIESAHYADMAAHAVKMVTEYGFTKVIIGHEYKGFWDAGNNRWDYEAYTNYYNTVYNAVKAAHPTVLVGGSYVVMAERGFGFDTAYNGVLIDSRDVDAHTYWLDNADGFDAVVLDLAVQIHEFKPLVDYLKALPNAVGLPHWHAEFYSANADTSASQRQAAQEIVDHATAGDIVLMWDEPGTFSFDLSLLDKSVREAGPSSFNTVFSNDVITLTWAAVSGATDYVIEARESADSSYVEMAISPDTAESITAAEWATGYGSALADGDYDFRVAARVGGVVQGFAYVANFTVSGVGSSSTTNPAQISPFTKQLAGATPSKVTAPTTWQLGGVLEGSQDYWNHPSTGGAFGVDGVAAIGGSAKTIVDTATRVEIGSNLSGGNVQWSQVTEGTIWYLNGSSDFRKRLNYGSDSQVFTAAEAGYVSLHFNGEGSMVDDNDRYVGLVGVKGDGTAWLFVWDLVLDSKVDEIQIAGSWSGSSTFDAWGMGPNGTTIVLDGNPAGTTTNNWKCFPFNGGGFTVASFAAAPVAAVPTRHFTLANLDGLDVLVTVDGYVMNGVTGVQIRRIETLGPGVSSAQHVGRVAGTSCVVWSNGSKAAAIKQVSLVWLDGSGFVYLYDAAGGWNGGEIYASGAWDEAAGEFWLATTHAQTGDSRLHLWS